MSQIDLYHPSFDPRSDLVFIGERIELVGRKTWGLLMVRGEERPSSLPSQYPDRVELCCLALKRGRSPIRDVPALLADAKKFLATYHSDKYPIALSCFGAPKWLEAPLQAAGFTLLERVHFLEINRLGRRRLEIPAGNSPAQLRPLRANDFAELARLDAAAFPAHWHFGTTQLRSLATSCRFCIAEVAETMAGYSALEMHPNRRAHLARLAVAPQFQRQRIGRQLLQESLIYARQRQIENFQLNTQVDNHPASQLYQQAGFRPTGTTLPLYTYLIG